MPLFIVLKRSLTMNVKRAMNAGGRRPHTTGRRGSLSKLRIPNDIKSPRIRLENWRLADNAKYVSKRTISGKTICMSVILPEPNECIIEVDLTIQPSRDKLRPKDQRKHRGREPSIKEETERIYYHLSVS